MKKVFLLFGVAAFMASTVFVGCKKEETSSPVVPDMSKTATIKGKVEANLTIVNDTNKGFYLNGFFSDKYEFAPQGTKVFFKIQANQFSGSTVGASEFLMYSTVVEGNGEYSINVPVTNQGVTITVIPDDFIYNQEQAKKATINGAITSVSDGTKRKVYNANTQNISLTNGKTEVVDFQYNAN